VALPLFREGFAALKRLRCPPQADNSTLAPRKVFLSDVHAAGKNDLILFRRFDGETLRGFLTV